MMKCDFRIRSLRDRLVREEKLELAFSVSVNFHLDSEPVWAAWGLSLLKKGEFELAKEKLKYCFGEIFEIVNEI